MSLKRDYNNLKSDFQIELTLLARPILKSRVWFQTKCTPLTSPLNSITIIDLTRGGLLFGLFEGNISMQSKFRKADIQPFKKWNLVLFSSWISTSRRCDKESISKVSLSVSNYNQFLNEIWTMFRVIKIECLKHRAATYCFLEWPQLWILTPNKSFRSRTVYGSETQYNL